MRLKFIKITKS